MRESLPNAKDITQRTPQLSKEKIEENLQRAKDTGRMMERFYWEAVKRGEIEHEIKTREEPTVPPIDSTEVFDPKLELDEIKTLPKAEKRARLDEFKEKLAYQKEGVARAQEELISLIRGNPDMDWFDLWNKAYESVVKYGLSEPQEKRIHKVLSNYWWRHEAVRKAREEFPDDDKLFEAVLGKPPTGEIEVIEGPVTLYFRCHSLSDYALISQQTFLEDRMPSIKERLNALGQGGVNIGTSKIERLRGAITAERAFGAFDEERKAIYVHEEQHSIKRLFDERPTRSMIIDEGAPLDQELRMRRERLADLRAKDEILAYMKEGRWSPKEIFKILTESGRSGGLYDYLSKYVPSTIAQRSEGKSLGEKRKVKKMVEKIFVKEYHTLISSGIQSFQDLIDNGFTLEQAIALLNAEPLAKWPKVVKRLTKIV